MASDAVPAQGGNDPVKDDPNDDFDPKYDANHDNKHDKTENEARGAAKDLYDTAGPHQSLYAQPNPKPVKQG